MQRTRVRRVGALVLGLALVAAACGDDDDDDGAAPDTTEGGAADTTAPAADTTAPAADTTAPAADTTAPAADTTAPASDTTAAGGADQCGFAASDVTGGDLAGFGGTTPYGEISEDFFNRLCEVDPALTDLNYAAETYDAVIITALAAAIAGDDGIAHASEINGVTRDGEKCTTYADCLALIEGGTTDIDYDGASGPGQFAGNGEPLEGTYALLVMGDNNRIDPTLTEYLPFQGPPDLDVPPVAVEGQREGDGTLTLGANLPQTGSLAFLGPPMFAGFDLACQELNENGGVLGQDVTCIKGDSGDTTTNQADQTADRQLAENIDAMIGTASSSVSLSIIDKVVSAGVTMFSPANTSTELSEYPDNGLYFRTAPPDIYQGDIIGQFIVNDGHQNVAFIHLNDSYGNSLADAAQAVIEESGGAVVTRQAYDPAATSFDSEVAEVVASNPDAIWMCGFQESARILRALVEAGAGPTTIETYGCDGNIGNALGVDFDAGN
jgi:ABC-type branched-subunit amino acid transport system substrate-binding protein